jgi:hypothetical protein
VITIFGWFFQIFCERNRHFLENQCYEHLFLHKWMYILWVRITNVYFTPLFGQNILKIITSVPGHFDVVFIFIWVAKLWFFSFCRHL